MMIEPHPSAVPAGAQSTEPAPAGAPRTVPAAWPPRHPVDLGTVRPARRSGPVDPTAAALSVLRPLGLDAVRLDPAGLLGDWQERNARQTVPHCVTELERGGALGNLRRPLDDPAPHVGMWFSDSDVYKTVEAIAWRLGADPADTRLATVLADVARLLAYRQDADGYLNSYFQHEPAGRRWQELSTSHELYCAGHLIQAAVAAARAGVGTELMAVARRFADLIVERFGPDGATAVCGHPEIETALVELYRVTGHHPYLDLARRFVERRGHGLLGQGQFGAAYFQDHEPVRAAREFTGHAVRQVYLLAGVVDVAVETGDAELRAAAQRLWDSAFGTKTYITGAHGSRHRDEAVGDPYELPADRAYAETCAAIGSFQWNWRMLLATGRHRYADEMERVLYNAVAVATALDGQHFFYSNPLQLRTGHDGSGEDAPSRRLAWYSCACCPPNLARLFASLHTYVATQDATGVQLHLYAPGTVTAGPYSIAVQTSYPWNGRITATVDSRSGAEWTLALRVPRWCSSATLRVDGQLVDAGPVDGYLRLTRRWSGEQVELELAMPARLVAAHPRVDAVRGCVAVVRGPLVFGLEQVDLAGGTVLEDVAIEAGAPVRVLEHAAGAPIPVTLTALGHTVGAPGPLYRDLASAPAGTPLTLTAIPYFLWGNRESGAMRVWIPLAEEPVDRTAPQPGRATEPATEPPAGRDTAPPRGERPAHEHQDAGTAAGTNALIWGDNGTAGPNGRTPPTGTGMHTITHAVSATPTGGTGADPASGTSPQGGGLPHHSTTVETYPTLTATGRDRVLRTAPRPGTTPPETPRDMKETR